MKIDLSDVVTAGCRRCRKPFIEGETTRLVHKTIPPPHGRTHWLDGDSLLTIAVYHERCVPPRLFHKFAGSLPAGQSLDDRSPSNGHQVVGGLSHKRRGQSRPSSRQRKIATRQREHDEQQTREQRQNEYTLTMTAADVLARGGKLGLCSCRTLSTMKEYFETQHGYCRYCGKWTPEVYREHLGEDALQHAINELAVRDRERMRQLVAVHA